MLAREPSGKPLVPSTWEPLLFQNEASEFGAAGRDLVASQMQVTGPAALAAPCSLPKSMVLPAKEEEEPMGKEPGEVSQATR
jgi:hypothetical protein